MKKLFTVSLMMVLAAAIALSGCGKMNTGGGTIGSGTGAVPTGGTAGGKAVKLGMVTDIGGVDIPVIKRFDLGKAAAATLYDDGVDIIFHASGATGNGVFSEAKDRVKSGKKVWVIGVDKDQSLEFSDDVTLTSMLKRVDQAVIRISQDVMNGNVPGGATTVLGLKEDGVGLPDTSKKNVPADVLAKVEEYKQKIISGEIKVPTAQ